MLPDRVVAGTVVLRGGRIADVQPGLSHLPSAQRLAHDCLIPGAIDLHSDNLERQVQPRNGVRWPSRSALLAHDAQCAAAGVTTVFDALCAADLGFDEDRPRTCREGAADLLELAAAGALRVGHWLHVRCEVPAAGIVAALEPLLPHPLLRLISLMDHTPGHGQYADLAQYRAMRARDGEAAALTDARIDALVERRARWHAGNRAALLRLAGTVPLASHDDRTEAHVAANARDGITIAEFPVTLAAAAAAHLHAQQTIAGAPNVVRGGSHTGNVSARTLIEAGLVDALASDYVPVSLIEAAFRLAAAGVLPHAAAVALITAGPARIAGFADRGRLAPGLRADLVRVRLHGAVAAAHQTWCGGERVA